MTTARLLPWQTSQWRQIAQTRSSGRLPHALLLKGPRGVGKGFFAERLATLLLCFEDGQEPCGRCRSCNLAGSGSHPDMRTVVAENDSATIGVQQIRDLIHSLTFTAALGRPKVGIINTAERMTTAAANSLLKTLEEPPGDALLILVANTGARLPATIISRCQFVGIPPVPQHLGCAWVNANIAEGHDGGLLLALSGGQPLTAVAWAETKELAARDTLFEDFIALLDGTSNPVQSASRWKTLGIECTTRWLGSLLMDCIKLVSTGERTYLINADLMQTMQPLVGQLDLIQLFSLLDICQGAARVAVTHTGLNEQLLLEDFAIAIASAMRRAG